MGNKVFEGTSAEVSQAQQLLSTVSLFSTQTPAKQEESQLVVHGKILTETHVLCPGVSFCGSGKASETVFKGH